MSNVVHFEISADDLERAADFYEQVFDWTIKRPADPSEYWFITVEEDEWAVTGGLVERVYPSESTVVTFNVDSLDDFAARITASGGKVLPPKLTIPGEAYTQYCQDPEGNVFGIIEFDESAGISPEDDGSGD